MAHPITRLGVVFVLTLLTACGAGDGAVAPVTVSSAVMTTAPEPSSTTTTVPPSSSSTRAPATTSTMALETRPTVVLLDSTPGAPRLLFVDEDGVTTAILPLDRRTPYVGAVVDDHQHGIVVTNSPPAAPAGSIVSVTAGSSDWRIVAGTEGESLAWSLPAVVGTGDSRALLYATESYDDYKDESGGDVLDHQVRLRLAPLNGDPAAMLLSASATTISHMVGSDESSGAVPEAFGMGDDLLMLLWGDESCGWLEFRRDGDVVDMSVNRLPQGTTCKGEYPSGAHLSRDGRYLVVSWPSPGRFEVYDLADGSEVGHYDETFGEVFFDGDRTLAATRRGADREAIGVVLATIGPNGLGIRNLGVDPGYGLVGVLGDAPLLGEGATLVSSGPVAPCSGAGAATLTPQLDLPEAVATTRNLMESAARACDLLALADLGDGLLWRSQSGMCESYPPVPITEADPVGSWFEAERSHDFSVTLLATLDQEPELVDGVYWWMSDRHEIGIAVDGAWVRSEWLPPVVPCETVWCGC